MGTELKKCPSCGAELPLDAPSGHCVQCLLKLGLAIKPEAGPADTIRIASTFPTAIYKPGDWIGRYKLLQQIGEGGCGVVYMAEQEEPVRRKVALKVIKLGMDTKQVIARFEAERQALAMMDHPHIAKVLDAGATETGRPYFVMELVRGIKITDYCDQNNLSTRERLELFMQICRAIQHAHQKGIIHRDIKPSNILVTMNDGVPMPKVIDFGIAKATHGKLTDDTLFTAFEQFIGTPAYMSPEQAEMSAMDIDTRSDIYSLGVLLYELLTGKTPFDAKELIEAGLDGIRRTIREREPARPSTRLSTMLVADLTIVAKNRKVEPPKLVNLLRGDLDWIVMKTMEKDRTRRYETANGLAADLQRHLSSEPVTACPPSTLYRFQKMVRRNKLVFVAGATIATVLVLAVVASSYQAVLANRAESLAQNERLKAQNEKERADQNAVAEKTQRQRAEAAATEARISLSTSHFLQACRFVEEDKVADAVAYLVASLRAYPANDAAVTRLATLLVYNVWPRPILNLQHTSGVISAQFTPDSKQLQTVARDGTARVWDAKTGLLLIETREHGNAFLDTQFSTDGKRLVTGVTGPEDGSALRLWNAQTGQRLTDVKHPNVRFARFSPDSKRLVTWSWNGPMIDNTTMQVWDAETGVPINKPFEEASQVHFAQFSPNGERLVTSGLHSDVDTDPDHQAPGWILSGRWEIWDADAGQPLADLKNAGPVRSLHFSLDGKRLLTGSAGSTARVWDVQTRQPLTEVKHTGPVTTGEFSPDGMRFVTASADNTARVWDAKTGQPVTDPLKHAGAVEFAHFSPDGKRLITAADDLTARVWDTRTGQPLTEPLKHSLPINSAQFSPDGKWIVTASDDGSARVWDVRTGNALTERLKHGNLATDAAQFSPDGARLVTISQNKTARFWNAQTGEHLPILDFGLGGEVASCQFSPDGRRLATVSDYQTARVWDTQTGRMLSEEGRSVVSAQFSPDSKRLVTMLDIWKMGAVQVWAAETGQPLTKTTLEDKERLHSPESGGMHKSAQFSLDGLRLLTSRIVPEMRGASLELTYNIVVWDARTGRRLTQIKHGQPVSCAQFSLDGQQVLTVSDRTAQVWNAQTGQPLGDPINCGVKIYSAQFSPDGKRLVIAWGDGTARVWDARTGQPLTGPLKHAKTVHSAQFSPDGKLIVTASSDNTARVWDAQTGQPLSEPFMHEGEVTSAQFSPDGKQIVTVSHDARVWDFAPPSTTYPAWLLQLCEAVSGQMLNSQGLLEETRLNRAETINQIREKLNRESGKDEWVAWGRWFLADPSTRTISPFSKLTVAEYIENRIKENTDESLDEAERLAADNPEILQRIYTARSKLKQNK